MDRLVSMILRQVTRQLVNKGVSAGINAASRGTQPTQPQNKEMANRQKKLVRAARRITRF